ncbi:MAG TPA: hypothetical protein PKE69_04990 [Pyrinomonadaceae bacterium]|nr:hypothetical protein [Pyrinomonadaceae bacterium]
MLFRIFLICLLIFVFSTANFAQNKQSCKVTKNLGGKYKLDDSYTSLVEGRGIFFLRIKLKPKNINKGYLLEVAQRIKETYCNENIIYAEIWDSSDKRIFDDLTPPPIFPPWARAIYSLDRIENKEMIQFISSDKITDEIRIQN